MSENLIKALHSSEFLARELREAHTDAVNSGNKPLERALFWAQCEAANLHERINYFVERLAEPLSRAQSSD